MQDKGVYPIAMPRELRDEIYRYALAQDANCSRLWDHEAVTLAYRYGTYGEDTKAQPALLLASRQLRVEALALYYTSNNFRVLTCRYLTYMYWTISKLG